MNNSVLPKPGASHGAPETLLLTKAAAAEYLGIRPRTLDDWRAAKAVPCIQRGRYIRFLRADLDDFLSRHRVTAKPTSPYRPRGSRTSHGA
ncbi:MAG: helix-turn-helix domain-containing protein [Verrucomicrobiales bacterium]